MNQKEAENFIKAWQTSNHVTDVMEKLGLSYRQVGSRAYRLRKQGIPLKPYGRAGDRLDVQPLKRLAESLHKETSI